MGKKPTRKELEQRVKTLEQEVAQLKALQMSSKEADEPLLELIEAVPDAVFLKDVQGRHLFVNKASEELMGLSRQKILGKTHYDLLPADLADFCARSDVETIKGAAATRLEEEMTDTEGNKHTFETIKVPFLNNLGEVAGLVGISRDITERKRAEEALRASEQRFRLLVETMNEGLATLDKDARFSYVNDRFCQMLGYARDELLGRLASDLHDETQKKILKEQFQRRRQGASDPYEITFLRKDGGEVFTVISPRPRFDADGSFEGSFAVVTDVTNLKKVEHDLRRREAELRAQSTHLQEVNTAMKVLLKQREEDKAELEENVLSHVKQLVAPYLERLRKTRLSSDQKALVGILEVNLDNITSPLVGHLSSKYLSLTPTEIRVADLVKEGKTNKEIADLLCISGNTVKFHRFNLRSKLGVRNQRINLRSYLMSLAK